MKRLSLAGSCVLVMWLIGGYMALQGQPFSANYDESKVPTYTLPDPLICDDGTRVADAATWIAHRRPEILRHFAEQMYGKAPDTRVDMRFTTVEQGDALGGLATRKQVTLTFSVDGTRLDVSVLLYIPNQASAPSKL